MPVNLNFLNEPDGAGRQILQSDAMLNKMVAERALDAMSSQPAIFDLSVTMNDEEFAEHLANAQLIDGDIDYVSHRIYTGIDAEGRRCLWIESGLKDGSNQVIVLTRDMLPN